MTLAELEHEVKEIQIALEDLSQRLGRVHQEVAVLLIKERRR
jgi:prefoldin subunit 5